MRDECSAISAAASKHTHPTEVPRRRDCNRRAPRTEPASVPSCKRGPSEKVTRMDGKLKDDGSKAPTPMPTAKRKGSKQGQPDDCGQIDGIVGPYGKYQFLIFLFKILIGATSAFNNLGVTFYAPTNFVGYSCADTDLVVSGQNHSAAASLPLLGYGGPQQPHEAGPNISATPAEGPFGAHPWELEAHESVQGWAASKLLGEFIYNEERLRRHASPYFSSDTPRNLRQECLHPSGRKCASFKYDTGIWISTIIDEWDLVCDRSVLVSTSQSLYMSGFIISYLLFGYLSDRFGRWRSLLFGALIEVCSGFGCALSTSVTQFMAFRFLLGLGNAGRSSSSYLIMIEWTGQSWRMPISTLGSLGWMFGYCSMPWISLHFLHFRHMQLFVCFYELVLLFWLLQLPESPRWLLTHRRFDEAYEVLLKAARFNGLIKPEGGSSCGASVDDGCSKSSADELEAVVKPPPVSSRRPTGESVRKLDPGNPILADGSFARKRLNSVSAQRAVAAAVAAAAAVQRHDQDQLAHHHLHHQQQQQQQPQQLQQQQQDQQQQHEAIILAPNHEVAAHVEVPAAATQPQCPFVPCAAPDDQLQPYELAEFDRKFARLARTISQKEFTKNEDRLSIIDLFRWRNLRKYTLILAFIWSCNSFIYYGIALRVGDFGGKNLFVSFSFAGATELPSIFFTILFMKFLPRKTTNSLMFSIIFLLCALQVPLRSFELGWQQQASMILAKLFNACSFVCILYQTIELFPTSIRQTAYSTCSLAGRFGSILAPYIKELSQLTNPLVPPVMYAVLSVFEVLLIRHLPETHGSDLPDTLLEAERFKGTDTGPSWRLACGKKQALANGGHQKPAPPAASAECCSNGAKRQLPPA